PDGLVIAEAGRTVWANDPGTAFLSAATGEVEVEEHRGYFWPEVRHDEQWVDQAIERAAIEGGALTISGTLGDVGWRVTIAEREQGGAVMTATADEVDALTLTSGRSPGAGVHGFGEQFDDF